MMNQTYNLLYEIKDKVVCPALLHPMNRYTQKGKNIGGRPAIETKMKVAIVGGEDFTDMLLR